MRTLIFGIRKSALAQRQLDEFIIFLTRKKLSFNYSVKTLVTKGDQNKTLPVDQMGQGIFTKEIELALLSGEIDCAVHSLKDMPVKIEKGTVLSCFPPRHDARDCLVVPDGVPPKNLKRLRIGTGSPRRTTFLKEIESTAQALPIRGNIDTRLRKLDNGDYDALILAACGLKRLRYESRIAHYFDPAKFVPAAGQGIICSQTRVDDEELNDSLKRLSCVETEKVTRAERKVLTVLGIGCQVPFGVNARFEGEKFFLSSRGYVAAKKIFVEEQRICLATEWEAATDDLAQQMKIKFL
jgi:hydroxymethylbilane synthase